MREINEKEKEKDWDYFIKDEENIIKKDDNKDDENIKIYKKSNFYYEYGDDFKYPINKNNMKNINNYINKLNFYNNTKKIINNLLSYSPLNFIYNYFQYFLFNKK